MTTPDIATHEETLTTANQRRVALIWESTQAAIAVLITLAVIYCSVKALNSETLTNAFFLIVGFYFSRATNAVQNGTSRKRLV